jgi:hypothetical protein
MAQEAEIQEKEGDVTTEDTEIKTETKVEGLKIEGVRSETPRYEFAGMGLASDVQTEEPEEILEKKERKRPYTIPEGLLGKSINAIMKFLASRYPEIQDQLMLGEEEEQLLDTALKPMLESFLKKTKTDANIVTLILAIAAIMLPRILLVAKAEGDRRKLVALKQVKESV